MDAPVAVAGLSSEAKARIHATPDARVGPVESSPDSGHDRIRQTQQAWAATPIRERLRVLRKARRTMAADAEHLAASVPVHLPGSLHRSAADTLMAEVLPLLDACRFLEREAAWILRPQRRDTSSRPFWLGGVTTEVQRTPLGIVLIIGPANYPLFLPGVQALQALAAGNAVLWKPAPGAPAVALAMRAHLVNAGLDSRLLQVLDESPAAATKAIEAGVDKVFLTGSAATGRSVMRALAETLTPSVMELSDCAAVFVLEGADLAHVTEAVTFGLRLNGSATCMAPRRLFVTAAVANTLIPALAAQLSAIEPVPVPEKTHAMLEELTQEAESLGANILLNGLDADRSRHAAVGVTLLSNVQPDMLIAEADIFAPVLSVIQVRDEDAMAALTKDSHFLAASIFGTQEKASAFAAHLQSGNILINDIIVLTADPRAPFGGRGSSGFGSTRGPEGLLEMTAPKTIQTQRGSSKRFYQRTTSQHTKFFLAYIAVAHAKGWSQKLAALRDLTAAARGIG